VLEKPSQETHSSEVRQSFESLPQELADAVEKVDPAAYALACSARSRLLNLYIDRTKPWALAKKGTPEDLKELREVLFTLLEGIRWLATAWMSILPTGMPKAFQQLGLPTPQEQGAVKKLIWGELGIRPVEAQPIYPRLELPEHLKG